MKPFIPGFSQVYTNDFRPPEFKIDMGSETPPECVPMRRKECRLRESSFKPNAEEEARWDALGRLD